ncbi:MAG TPA: hypothetical protein VGM30_00715 [Puia sp.]
MKKILLATFILLSVALFSCARSVTPGEAASHHYSHCRDMR